MINKNKLQKVVSWLKGIFSVQTIAAIAAVIGAVYAYKTYRENRPAQLKTEFYSYFESMNVNEIHWFINMITPSSEKSWPILFETDYPSISSPSGIPRIANNSNKGIKNFRLEIYISYSWLKIYQDDICSDFEIIKMDTTMHMIELRYKYDVLNAKSAIPHPILSKNLQDYVPFLDYEGSIISLLYRITYDGIPEPRVFEIMYFTNFNKENSIENSDDYLDRFLTMCYRSGYFTSRRHSSLVAIINKSDTQIINPPKKLTDEKFERFKKDFIENNNQCQH